MDKTSNKYDNKALRFYDKDDHYELWFMDDFNTPGSGKMWEGDSEYTLICDITEELHNGDPNKELHIFIWSFGGAVDTLSTLLQCIEKYRRKVAVNLGCCDSCGWMLFFACDERYAAKHSEFLYHEPSLFQYGKQEECAARIEFQRKRLAAMFLNENLRQFLTPDEQKLGQTTEIWFTGDEMISRGACWDYSCYRNRIAPKLFKNQFFTFDNRIFRYVDGMMREYVPNGIEYFDANLLTHHTDDLVKNDDIRQCEKLLTKLLTKVKKASNPKEHVILSDQEETLLRKIINKCKE